jgi:hypothetical protein
MTQHTYTEMDPLYRYSPTLPPLEIIITHDLASWSTTTCTHIVCVSRFSVCKHHLKDKRGSDATDVLANTHTRGRVQLPVVHDGTGSD